MARKQFSYKLRSTRDYRLFIEHEKNRDVRQTSLLEASMITWGYDPGFPIRVMRGASGKFIITHGHRRFSVAKTLKLPVWFIECEQDIPLYETEASAHAWNLEDYTQARAKDGNEGAIQALAMRERTGIPLGTCLGLVGGGRPSSGKINAQMKQGLYAPQESSVAVTCERVVTECKRLGAEFVSTDKFVKALLQAMEVEQFDVDVFLARVRTNADLMQPCRTIDLYLELIETVYNWKTLQSKRVPIAFEAKRLAADRKTNWFGSREATPEEQVEEQKKKTCARCGNTLAAAAFRKRRANADGLRPMCKNCEAVDRANRRQG